ncbi:MAG: hypothetical protein PVG39_00180 [Desulfobacteraceae bacterium]|jgi:hypothetical protein
MAKTKQKASEPKAWRFYRSNLSTIVWNPKSEQPLADFTAGHFTTDDPKVARTLRELGYPEIPLDASEPPANVIISQPTQAIDGDVPIVRSLMNQAITPTPSQEKAVEKNLAMKTHSVGGPPALRSEEQTHSSGITKLPRRRKKKTA